MGVPLNFDKEKWYYKYTEQYLKNDIYIYIYIYIYIIYVTLHAFSFVDVTKYQPINSTMRHGVKTYGINGKEALTWDWE